MFVGTIFLCDACQIRAVKSGKMTKKCHGKSENSNRADRWEPCQRKEDSNPDLM